MAATIPTNGLGLASGLAITDGDLTFASGHGISFAADSSATDMTSELLDDYEEGTFTPTFNGTAGGASGVSYTSRLGWYEKIGNQVTCHILLDSASMTSVPSGGATVTGLPFTSVNVTARYHSVNVGYCNYWASTEAPSGGYVTANTTYINLVTGQSADVRDNMAETVTAAVSMGGNEEVMIHVAYRSE